MCARNVHRRSVRRPFQAVKAAYRAIDNVTGGIIVAP